MILERTDDLKSVRSGVLKIAGPVVILLLLSLLAGCSYMAEGKARCQALYGPDFDYNGVADRCVNWSAPMVPMVPFVLNPSTPSPRYTAPPIVPMPMNRCNSLIIGDQITTTCF
jgi:hypothetical protein